MKVKAIPYIFIVLIILLISNSCIVINQPKDASEETTASDEQSNEDTEEAIESEEDATNKETDESEEAASGNTDSDTIDKEEDNIVDDLSDQIIVSYPLPDQLIYSPLIITGEARGTWFFEANFSVSLFDSNGETLALHYASTDEEWMTEDFISFTANIEFDDPQTATGILILEKNNPSDIREHDAQLEIQVRFE